MTNPGVTGLRAYWKLDENTGNRYSENDALGDVELTNNNTVASTTGHQKYTGKSANFVRANSESLSTVDGNDWLQPGNQSFGIGAWIQPHQIGTFSTILSKWAGAGNQEYALQIHTNGKVRFYVHDGTNGFVKYADQELMVSNNWYFATGEYNAETNIIRCGINNKWSQLAGPTTGIDITNAHFYLATTQDLTDYYDGLMDEVFVYMKSRVLTTAEWDFLYNYGHGRRYEDLTEEYIPPVIEVKTEPMTPLVHVYNKDLEALGVIEDYYSLNWAERYNSFGDFELELPIEYLAEGGASDELIVFGNFLSIANSDKIMIIEEIKPEITSDNTSLLVNGRSAESILERRVLLDPITFAGTAELLAYLVVDDNLRDPLDADRKIAIFDSADPRAWPPSMISEEYVIQQFVTENVYEVVEAICKLVDIGFKIVVGDFVTDSELYFYIYTGADRSVGQSDYDWVAFADSLDNVLESSFYSSELEKVNTTYVITDDAVYPTRFTWLGTEQTGIDRFEGVLETTIDRDSDGDDIDDLTDAEVLAIIRTRGGELIKQSTPVGVFEGDFDAHGTFVYNEDFFMGDIVQCVMFQQNVKARVIELVRSYSAEGEKVYLAFDFLV